jgi:hypothetical protein
MEALVWHTNARKNYATADPVVLKPAVLAVTAPHRRHSLPVPDEVTRWEKCALFFLSAGLDACAKAETSGLGDMQREP